MLELLEHIFLSQTLERLINVQRAYANSLQQLKAAMKGTNQFNVKYLAERERMTKDLAVIENDIKILMPVVQETGLKIMEDCKGKYNIAGLQFLIKPEAPKLVIAE